MRQSNKAFKKFLLPYSNGQLISWRGISLCSLMKQQTLIWYRTEHILNNFFFVIIWKTNFSNGGWIFHETFFTVPTVFQSVFMVLQQRWEGEKDLEQKQDLLCPCLLQSEIFVRHLKVLQISSSLVHWILKPYKMCKEMCSNHSYLLFHSNMFL